MAWHSATVAHLPLCIGSSALDYLVDNHFCLYCQQPRKHQQHALVVETAALSHLKTFLSMGCFCFFGQYSKTHTHTHAYIQGHAYLKNPSSSGISELLRRASLATNQTCSVQNCFNLLSSMIRLSLNLSRLSSSHLDV